VRALPPLTQPHPVADGRAGRASADSRATDTELMSETTMPVLLVLPARLSCRDRKMRGTCSFRCAVPVFDERVNYYDFSGITGQMCAFRHGDYPRPVEKPKYLQTRVIVVSCLTSIDEVDVVNPDVALAIQNATEDCTRWSKPIRCSSIFCEPRYRDLLDPKLVHELFTLCHKHLAYASCDSPCGHPAPL
jgi:hypothetical protein